MTNKYRRTLTESLDNGLGNVEGVYVPFGDFVTGVRDVLANKTRRTWEKKIRELDRLLFDNDGFGKGLIIKENISFPDLKSVGDCLDGALEYVSKNGRKLANPQRVKEQLMGLKNDIGIYLNSSNKVKSNSVARDPYNEFLEVMNSAETPYGLSDEEKGLTLEGVVNDGDLTNQEQIELLTETWEGEPVGATPTGNVSGGSLSVEVNNNGGQTYTQSNGVTSERVENRGVIYRLRDFAKGTGLKVAAGLLGALVLGGSLVNSVKNYTSEIFNGYNNIEAVALHNAGVEAKEREGRIVAYSDEKVKGLEGKAAGLAVSLTKANVKLAETVQSHNEYVESDKKEDKEREDKLRKGIAKLQTEYEGFKQEDEREDAEFKTELAAAGAKVVKAEEELRRKNELIQEKDGALSRFNDIITELEAKLENGYSPSSNTGSSDKGRKLKSLDGQVKINPDGYADGGPVGIAPWFIAQEEEGNQNNEGEKEITKYQFVIEEKDLEGLLVSDSFNLENGKGILRIFGRDQLVGLDSDKFEDLKNSAKRFGARRQDTEVEKALLTRGLKKALTKRAYEHLQREELLTVTYTLEEADGGYKVRGEWGDHQFTFDVEDKGRVNKALTNLLRGQEEDEEVSEAVSSVEEEVVPAGVPLATIGTRTIQEGERVKVEEEKVEETETVKQDQVQERKGIFKSTLDGIELLAKEEVNSHTAPGDDRNPLTLLATRLERLGDNTFGNGGDATRRDGGIEENYQRSAAEVFSERVVGPWRREREGVKGNLNYFLLNPFRSFGGVVGTVGNGLYHVVREGLGLKDTFMWALRRIPVLNYVIKPVDGTLEVITSRGAGSLPGTEMSDRVFGNGWTWNEIKKNPLELFNPENFPVINNFSKGVREIDAVRTNTKTRMAVETSLGLGGRVSLAYLVYSALDEGEAVEIFNGSSTPSGTIGGGALGSKDDNKTNEIYAFGLANPTSFPSSADSEDIEKWNVRVERDFGEFDNQESLALRRIFEKIKQIRGDGELTQEEFDNILNDLNEKPVNRFEVRRIIRQVLQERAQFNPQETIIRG